MKIKIETDDVQLGGKKKKIRIKKITQRMDTKKRDTNEGKGMES